MATTSSGVAASLGWPDGEQTPVDEMFAAVGRIARVVDVPLTADASQLTGGMWRIKADYTYYTLKQRPDLSASTPAWTFDVYEMVGKSRGPLVDGILKLRTVLVKLAENPALPAPDPNFGEPLAGPVDAIVKGIDNLLKGEQLVDKDKLLDELQSVAGTIITAAKSLFSQLTGGESPETVLTKYATSLATAFGTAASSYLHYWIKNIDAGLQHWAEVGLAVSRGLFDPGSRRDLQNDEGKHDGPDVVDTVMRDARADTENGVTHIDAILKNLEDPNHDDKTDDGFANQYLLARGAGSRPGGGR